MEINAYLTIMFLNVNGLSTPMKRQSGRLDKGERASNLQPIRDPQNVHIDWKWGDGKDISCKHKW